MHPLSPVIPSANADEVVYAEKQSEYAPLPCIKAPDGAILIRWSVNEEEMRQIAQQGYIYLCVMTFNQPLQPLLMTTYIPEGFETRPLEEWPTEIDA
jgi:hypothetical protein